MGALPSLSVDSDSDSPLECLGQALGLALDLEDLDCAVGGACGEAPAIVIEDSIVLVT